MSFLGPVLQFAAERLVPLASTGMQIASAAGAFKGKSSSKDASASILAKQQTEADAEAAAEEKKRQAYLASKAGGMSSTILSPLNADLSAGVLKTKLGG